MTQLGYFSTSLHQGMGHEGRVMITSTFSRLVPFTGPLFLYFINCFNIPLPHSAGPPA